MKANTPLKLLSFLVAVLNVTDTNAETTSIKRVRLVDGESPYDGLVEVFDDTGWTPLCQSGWQLHEADILCNELVPGNPGAMWSGREDGALTGDLRPRIINVRCNGDEMSIADCTASVNPTCLNSATTKCNYDGYLGCYNNVNSDSSWADGYFADNDMTIQLCLNHCRKLNTSYAMLRNKNHCYCGIEGTAYWIYGEAEHGECSRRCGGDDTQVCGGNTELSVYIVTLGACGGSRNGSGIIYSPGFPGNYSGIMNCLWTITTPGNTSIWLNFVIDNRIGTVHVFEEVNSKYVNVSFDNGTAMSCSNQVFIQLSLREGMNEMGLFAIEYTGIDVYPDCQPPPNLKVEINFKSNGPCIYYTGDVISITCDKGYDLSSTHHSIECQQDGSWDDTFPTCEATTCGDPGYVDNADRNESQFTYLDTVTYTCTDGFYINGSDTITCTHTGRWTAKPLCIQQDKPSQESHSSNVTGIVVGTLVPLAIVIALAVLVVIFIYKRRSKHHRPRELSMHFTNQQYGDAIEDSGNYDHAKQQTSLRNEATPYEEVTEDGNGHFLFGRQTPEATRPTRHPVDTSVLDVVNIHRNNIKANNSRVVEDETGESVDLSNREHKYVINATTGKEYQNANDDRDNEVYANYHNDRGDVVHEIKKRLDKRNEASNDNASEYSDLMNNVYELTDSPDTGFVDNMIYGVDDLGDGVTGDKYDEKYLDILPNDKLNVQVPLDESIHSGTIQSVEHTSPVGDLGDHRCGFVENVAYESADADSNANGDDVYTAIDDDVIIKENVKEINDDNYDGIYTAIDDDVPQQDGTQGIDEKRVYEHKNDNHGEVEYAVLEGP
ncbi:uncharacterized protein LOC144448087 [Glandiceps talaboti]